MNPIPVLPVRNTVLFPHVSASLFVGRPMSVAAIKGAGEIDNLVLVVAQKDSETADPAPEDLHRIATLCRIETIRESTRRGLHVVATGLERYRIDEVSAVEGRLQATARPLVDEMDVNSETEKALVRGLKDLAIEILEIVPAETGELVKLVAGVEDAHRLTHLIAGSIDAPVARKQELLETVSFKTRALGLLSLLQEQKDALQVQNQIREKLSHKLGKAQREVLLREQLNTIREELGESGSGKGFEEYRRKIKDARMPADAEKTALDELSRLETIGNSSPEAHVIRNYLDLLCALPWSQSADSRLDLGEARRILDEDHYGLEKIKDRILQHLAVMKLRKEEGKGSILLFVGPPGVGKTSLGQSIARALGRKFVRVSLGGVRDDAEIRGHRRTYIGAMPGRIIQGLKRARENNPVLMLDEIDKMSRSFQGDPSSALLEVLDPEQNANFLDHYLDVPFDLSKVFFVATANSLETIPEPLLDRMEVIQLAGYTTLEKLHIAQTHLIPKQLRDHGIDAEQLKILDDALERIVGSYTREAGVRELQRRIAAVARASATRILELEPGTGPVTVTAKDLEDILGAPRFFHEIAEQRGDVGVVTGLAWTPQGGEILFLEATAMPGNGRLILTGQLGEVMKESAQIALSLVRSRIASGNHRGDPEKLDIHVHVPAGAIPKDGPSAGLAMLSAVASLLTERSVRPDIAMTGEITLRGAVMPVGGIKEKVLAAHRAGIKTVILPSRNEVDLKEVPAEVRDDLKFHFASTAQDVLKLVLDLDLPATRRAFSPRAVDGATAASGPAH